MSARCQTAETPARVFTAEHLAAIALQTSRARDHARLLQFVEAAALDRERYQAILQRHGLVDRWRGVRWRRSWPCWTRCEIGRFRSAPRPLGRDQHGCENPSRNIRLSRGRIDR